MRLFSSDRLAKLSDLELHSGWQCEDTGMEQ